MKEQLNQKQQALHLDDNYMEFLNEVKDRLKRTQIRAALAANRELIRFYWQLGSDIIKQQESFKWGEHFLEQLSHDMRQAFPEMQGFSVRNLQRMRQFANLYPNLIATQAVPQLPWGHIVRLIQLVKEGQIREWYAQQAIKNGWSRAVLEMQIESNLYQRQGLQDKKTTNFQECLPHTQSDLAHEILKDPYNFDFLTIQDKAQERAIENALVTHMCKSKNKIVAEYALQNMKAPIGISQYQLAKALPKELETDLPTVEQIESELNDAKI